MRRKLPLLLMLVVWLAGCAIMPGKTPPVSSVQKHKKSHTEQKQTLPAPPVYLIISRQLAPYTAVADILAKELGDRAQAYTLPKDPEDRSKLLQQIAANQRAQVVAIGLDAALFTRPLKGNNQVFCQVFNYTEYGLSGQRRKGVSMLPGVDKTLATWKALSPSLHDVAIISGSGLEQVLKRVANVAASQGITLHTVAVANDKEFLYVYKQMASTVQGYWLLPDNRVLSLRTLKDVMNFSVRNGKQVVVFNKELLRLGGLFSVSSRYEDIANKVIQRLEQSEDKESVPGVDLLPLDEIDLKINPVMARRLGLNIPDQYRDYAGEKAAH